MRGRCGVLLVALMGCLLLGCSGQNSEKAGVSSKPGVENSSRSLVVEQKSSGISGGGILFSVDADKQEAAVVGYDDLEFTEVVIPDVVRYEDKEYPVTAIEESAFESNQSVQKMTVGGNVHKIGESAFYCCPELEQVALPQGVKSIGKEAFAECEKLKDVVIPDGVSEIGESAFRACVSIESVELPKSVTTLGEGVYTDCGSLKRFVAADGMTALGDGMFTNCLELTEVVLPDTVTVIGKETFWGCMELVDLTLPDAMTAIGDRAFYSTSIKSLHMPKSLSGIRLELLEGMDSLETITVPEDKKEMYENVFENYGIEIVTD